MGSIGQIQPILASHLRTATVTLLVMGSMAISVRISGFYCLESRLNCPNPI